MIIKAKLALCIAIRYSAVRKQFGEPKEIPGTENKSINLFFK